MEWICEQEGIEADAEALAVLAQAGEGSVRDSLSALDQAIACCGDEARRAPRCASCSGCFSLDIAGAGDAGARQRSDSRRMLEIVRRTERNGQQPAALLPRAGALLPQPAGGEGSPAHDTRLIAASPAEQERLAAIAAAVFRRGPDALSAAHAGPVPRLAVFAAAALAPGTGPAAAGARGQADADRRGAGGAWRRRPAPPRRAAAAAPPTRPRVARAARAVRARKPAPRAGSGAAAPPRPGGSLQQRSCIADADRNSAGAVHRRRGRAFRSDRKRAANSSSRRPRSSCLPMRASDIAEGACSRLAGRACASRVTVAIDDGARRRAASPQRRRTTSDRRARARPSGRASAFRKLFPGSQVRTVARI